MNKLTKTEAEDLNYQCKYYISLIMRCDLSINRVTIHEKISKHLGVDARDLKLKEKLGSLDIYIELPIKKGINRYTITKYGNKLYDTLIKDYDIKIE